MARIYQGNLPKKINVVVNRKVITTAIFDDEGIYVTDNDEVIKELKEYGYEVKEGKKPKKIEEID